MAWIAAWIGIDAHRNRVTLLGRTYTWWRNGWLTWVLLCLVFWFVITPVYLLRRHRILKARKSGTVQAMIGGAEGPDVPTGTAVAGPETEPAVDRQEMAPKRRGGGSRVILVFDVETTGLPKSKWAGLDDFDNWPRVVQLGWVLMDNRGEMAEPVTRTVKPEGFIIPPAAVAKHGITTERARAEGLPLPMVLTEFAAVVEQSHLLVAHNMQFDGTVVRAEYRRARMRDPLKRKRTFCTMEGTTDICQIPPLRDGKWKWPKLSELHEILFGERPGVEHDAGADARTCAQCLRELMQQNLVRLPI
jgi:DNA polymerase III epsilon subunit-like protein